MKWSLSSLPKRLRKKTRPRRVNVIAAFRLNNSEMLTLKFGKKMAGCEKNEGAKKIAKLYGLLPSYIFCN